MRVKEKRSIAPHWEKVCGPFYTSQVNELFSKTGYTVFALSAPCYKWEGEKQKKQREREEDAHRAMLPVLS